MAETLDDESEEVDLTEVTERFTKQQQAAHQAIAEIVADLGSGFVLDAVADALEQSARTETGIHGDSLRISPTLPSK